MHTVQPVTSAFDLSPHRLQTTMARLGVIIPGGAISAFMLLGLMTILVAPQNFKLAVEDKPIPIDFLRSVEDTKSRPAEPPVVPMDLPDMPPVPPNLFDVDRDPGTSFVHKPAEVILPEVNPGGQLIQPGGEAFPLITVAPSYPVRAAQGGIEGWVLIELSIGPDGSVSKATILDAEPRSIFNRAALKAVRKWKFNPKVVDGVAVPQTGIRQRIVFQMEDS